MLAFQPLTNAILAACPDLAAEDLSYGVPPKLDLGDVAIPMFLAAKRLKSAPPKIAAEIAEKAEFGDWVSEVKPAGPYLHLKLNRAKFTRAMVEQVLEGGERFGSGATGAGQSAVIEHTSINPNASPHVGRARNAMIGDSISRLMRFEGYDLEVHYYVNDMGRQIGLLVLIAQELKGMTFDEVLDAYVAANERAKEDEAFAEEGYGLLVKMEQGDPEARRQFREVTDLCLNGQVGVLERIGAQYDVFDHESDYLTDPALEKVEAALEERGALFTDEESRLVVDMSKTDFPVGPNDEGRYFVLRRANGSSMYGYRDLAYTIHKLGLGASLNLWVLGEDHKMYSEQQAHILKVAGFEAPESIYYSYILLKDGKMSTRKGNVVLLSEFLDEASRLAAERVAEQCKQLSPEEQQVIAEQVAVAAIRFAVLRVGPNKNVTFDIESALSFAGDTGPYIQYSCARINSILRKYEGDASTLPEAFPVESDAEWQLLTKLASFPDVVASCVAQRAVAPVAVYVLETARTFTTFYHDCPVLSAETPGQVAARIQVCRATLQVMTNALGLLGIEAPERM